jgi:hypothetical protein
MANLFVLITGFTIGDDNLIYPTGSYALIDDNDNAVASSPLVGSIHVNSLDSNGDVQSKFITSCRNDCGDQQAPVVTVSGNF